MHCYIRGGLGGVLQEGQPGGGQQEQEEDDEKVTWHKNKDLTIGPYDLITSHVILKPNIKLRNVQLQRALACRGLPGS